MSDNDEAYESNRWITDGKPTVKRSVSKRWLRFGDVPAGGKSKNHLTGEDEAGISVYEAVEKDGVALPILPSLTRSACVSLSGVLERQAHWVTGRVVGNGSDGEPLLVDVEEVRGE